MAERDGTTGERDRAARLTAALRANLRRRKDQARARLSEDGAAEPPPPREDADRAGDG